VADLGLDSSDSPIVKINITPKEVLRRPGRNAHPYNDKHLHLILEVSDGELVAYQRVIFTILGPGSEVSQGTAQGHDEL
jgi:hypothetical protein